MWHQEAADYCSHVDYTIEKPIIQVKIARMQVHLRKFLAIDWGPQNVVAVLTSSHAWQPIALQLRGDCSIRRFKQIQLIWMMRCCYPSMTGWTLVRENCTSTTKSSWTALQTWATISGAICHYLGCVSTRSISHCITFCFTMKTQEMMTAHYGSWCWRIRWRQRPHRWTWQFPQQTNSHKLSCYLNVVCHGKRGCLRWAASTTHSCICS